MTERDEPRHLLRFVRSFWIVPVGLWALDPVDVNLFNPAEGGCPGATR